MTVSDLEGLSASDLVERFKEIALEQFEALLDSDVKEFNRLFQQMKIVSDELKARPGDQRTALLALYQHYNAQVRLKAAIHTLAVAPGEAVKKLEALSNSGEFPQTADARSILRSFKDGTFKPT